MFVHHRHYLGSSLGPNSITRFLHTYSDMTSSYARRRRLFENKIMESKPLNAHKPRSHGDNRSAFEIHEVANNVPKDGNRSRKRKTVTRFGATMSLACHVLTTGLTVYFTYVSFKSYQLFSWHPACMTIGSLALMAQAIMVMSQDNILAGALSRQGRVRMHWILQALAAGFIFAGFLVIVVNKNLRGKHHFVTLHAIVGLVSVVLVALTSSGGVTTLFSVRLKKFVKPAVVKLAHNILGIVTFAVGIISLVLGLYTNFYKKEAGFSSQVICTVILTLAGILTLESAVKSAYARFKSLSQT